MKKLLFILMAFAFVSTTTSCRKEGCTDPFALNFDIAADKDDGSCRFEEEIDPNGVNNNTNVGGNNNNTGGGNGGGGNGGGNGGGGNNGNPTFTAEVNGNGFTAQFYSGNFAGTYRTIGGSTSSGEAISVAYLTSDPTPAVGTYQVATSASSYTPDGTAMASITGGSFEVTAVNTTDLTFDGNFSLTGTLNGNPIAISNGQFSNMAY